MSPWKAILIAVVLFVIANGIRNLEGSEPWYGTYTGL